MTTLPVQSASAHEWAERITATWRKSVESIVEIGRLLAQAKREL
jgi:hypothetical protein